MGVAHWGRQFISSSCLVLLRKEFVCEKLYHKFSMRHEAMDQERDAAVVLLLLLLLLLLW
jgi:hypothetical protein